MSPAAENRFSVARNEMMMGLADVLGTQFPVVRKLLGDETFAAVAAQFVNELEVVSDLPWLGDEFPQFLRRFGCSASIQYLADIAELEKARGKAHRAPRISSILPCRTSTVLARRSDTLVIELHPSVSLIASRFPIVTIWEAYQSDHDYTLQQWGPEAALVAKPLEDIAVRRLPTGGCVFFNMLASGTTLAAAIDAATASEAAFDVGANLATLIESHVVIGLRDVP